MQLNERASANDPLDVAVDVPEVAIVPPPAAAASCCICSAQPNVPAVAADPAVPQTLPNEPAVPMQPKQLNERASSTVPDVPPAPVPLPPMHVDAPPLSCVDSAA